MTYPELPIGWKWVERAGFEERGVVMADIPEPLRREVLVEAGHRCAIPTCHQHPVDVHHIVPQSEGGPTSFENLIALCANCHNRYHRTKEIDRKSMQQYKGNLSIVTGRYGTFEQRILRASNKMTHVSTGASR